VEIHYRQVLSPATRGEDILFLDLRASTTIAETMDSRKFFSLMKEIFSDITESILNSEGEIYQYVGDEVVVTWTSAKGLSENNCLQCFFRISNALAQREEFYKRTYDVLPFFKAGLHIGEATVGEIGVIKKDIVYSGDVLNTTSRIQGECNNLGVDILLSSDLLNRMQLNNEYRAIALGDVFLKGKKGKFRYIQLRVIDCRRWIGSDRGAFSSSKRSSGKIGLSFSRRPVGVGTDQFNTPLPQFIRQLQQARH
jgi:adenylate cyclase